MGRHLSRAAVAATFALMAPALALPASAGPYTTTAVYHASGTPSPPANGDSPFADCDISGMYTSPSEINFVNTEVGPWVAINPTDPTNIIAVYQQDRWTLGAARGNVAAVTHDGGQTWTATWPHFSICAGGNEANGGNYQRARDPWVTFSPNGDAYFISRTGSPVGTPPGPAAILVSRSADGGDHWSEPVTLDLTYPALSPFFSPTVPSITADPFDSNFVYAVWIRSHKPGETTGGGGDAHSYRGDIIFSRSTDGGATWERATPLFEPKSNTFALNPQIAVLPDGTLVDVFDYEQGVGTFNTCCDFKLMRSADRGETWSDPIEVGPDRGVPAVDPDTGARIRSVLGRADLAVDLNVSSAAYGTLYAVWPDVVGSGNTKKRRYPTVVFTESNDGGLTWSPRVKVNRSPTGVQAINPSVDVASDGTVAVTYYDFRNNTPDPGVPTDHWLIHCHAGQDCTDSSSWAENHVAGPFDIELAPIFRGYFLGDYEGLASAGTTFLPMFVQTTSTDMANTYLGVVAP
jgi:hypothetical protein